MVKVTLREQLRRARSLAAQQFGLVTSKQLASFGLSGVAIARLHERGNLVKVLRGVYVLPDARKHPLRDAAAICLWANDVVVSHRSAAPLLGLDLGPVAPQQHVDVLRQTAAYVPPGFVAHRTDRLENSDIMSKGIIRLTQPLRTLLDLAAEESEEVLANAFESAWQKGFVSPQRVYAYLDRLQAKCERLPKGSKALRAWCDGAARRERAMQSPMEVRFWLSARDADLAPSHVQFRFVDGLGPDLFPDFVWLDEKLIVETRGAAAHASAEKLRKNARRDARLAAAGWMVVVVTWDMLEPAQRDRTMRMLAETLESRRRTRAPRRVIHESFIVGPEESAALLHGEEVQAQEVRRSSP